MTKDIIAINLKIIIQEDEDSFSVIRKDVCQHSLKKEIKKLKELL